MLYYLLNVTQKIKLLFDIWSKPFYGGFNKTDNFDINYKSVLLLFDLDPLTMPIPPENYVQRSGRVI